MTLVGLETGSCAWLVRKARLAPGMACQNCVPLIQMTKYQAKSSGVETTGICICLHGSHVQQRRLQGKTQKWLGDDSVPHSDRHLRSNRRRSARVSPVEQEPKVFVAEPAGAATMNREYLHPTQRRDGLRKQRKTESLDAIRQADIRDPVTQRALLSVMTGVEEGSLNLIGSGKSKCAKRRAEVTIGNATNCLVGMLSKRNPSQSEAIRSNLSEIATKRARKNPTSATTTATTTTTSTTTTPAPTDDEEENNNNLQVRLLPKEQLPIVCGTALRNQILQEKNGMNRRPFLAAVSNFRKPDVEEYLGIKISHKEWNLVRIHARFPGPFKSATRAETFRCRVPDEILHCMLSFFDDSENTQRLAFGQAVRTILNNGIAAQLDNVQLVQSVRRTAVKFITALADEVESLTSPEDDQIDATERCTKVEGDTFRRCQHHADHDGKCVFTTKGTISVSAATDLVRSLSDQELKSLSGLDDVKTIQGRDNFIRMRKLVDRLCSNVEEANQLKQRIDESESFLKCSFMSHLSRTGSFRCNCLTCGFNDPKQPNDIVCGLRDEHRPSCIDCAKPFAVLETLQMLLTDKEGAKETTEHSLADLELFSESEHEIQRAYTDLREYRSHLARHKAEADFAAQELDSLRDDEAAVTSDYKMKILAAFFRMNQKKWFGQRGITGLGFMIAYNDPDDCTKKIVKFLLMLTDDTLQDAEQVACAKQYVYSCELPAWITRVRFRSDGAGCYKSQLHRSLQPHWTNWTGITEISLALDPAGAGKSALDGTFGTFGATLSTAVNAGHDLVCKDDILDLYTEGSGVVGLKLLGFTPDRTRLLASALSVSTESILRSELDESTGQLRMYKHSSYGDGALVRLEDTVFKTKSKKAITVVFARDLVSEVQSFLVDEMESKMVQTLLSKVVVSELIDVPHITWTFAVCGAALAEQFKPQCIGLRSTSNRKEEMRGVGMSRPGEGAQTAQQIQAKRVNRKKEKCAAKASTIETIREEKERNRVFCCPNKCPKTGRYCTIEFLSSERRDKHAASDKHCVFPSGITGKDKLVQLAGAPGGALAFGTRPNRLQGTTTHTVIPSAQGAPGERAADCYQRFNRKEGVPAYRKPAKLVAILKDLYAVRPKLDEKQMLQRMKAMRDTDGSLMFSYRKRGTPTPAGMKRGSGAWNAWPGCQECQEKPCKCNGMLLSEEQIKAWIGQETQRQKKDERRK